MNKSWLVERQRAVNTSLKISGLECIQNVHGNAANAMCLEVKVEASWINLPTESYQAYDLVMRDCRA